MSKKISINNLWIEHNKRTNKWTVKDRFSNLVDVFDEEHQAKYFASMNKEYLSKQLNRVNTHTR
jgi:hypothetical protein